MSEGREVAVAGNALPSSVADVKRQVAIVNQLLRDVMKEDVHFGTIPGTQKPALYKPGAEKIGMMFGLYAEFEVERMDLDDGHREYTVTARLHTRDGMRVGEGVGTCTTMEGKYRFRWDNTNVAVPQEYWQTRDPAILGGPQFAPRKQWVDDGRGGRSQKWLIFQKVDHDNPADYYNTALKMAKKRAHIDAILTTTAASDIFDQDIEDPDAVPPSDPPPAGNGGGSTQAASKKKAAAKKKPAAKAGGDAGEDAPATENQIRLIRSQVQDKGLDEGDFLGRFEVNTYEEIRRSQVNAILEYLQSLPRAAGDDE